MAIEHDYPLQRGSLICRLFFYKVVCFRVSQGSAIAKNWLFDTECCHYVAGVVLGNGRGRRELDEAPLLQIYHYRHVGQYQPIRTGTTPVSVRSRAHTTAIYASDSTAEDIAGKS